MTLRFDIKYERSKKKISKKIDIDLIINTQNIYKSNPSDSKLNLKNIICKRDKEKQSIRVLGNGGYRIY